MAISHLCSYNIWFVKKGRPCNYGSNKYSDINHRKLLSTGAILATKPSYKNIFVNSFLYADHECTLRKFSPTLINEILIIKVNNLARFI